MTKIIIKQPYKYCNLVGNIYGKLTVISQQQTSRGKRRWLCKCECGGNTTTTTDILNVGDAKSCGCSRKHKVEVLTQSIIKDHLSYNSETGIVSRRKTVTSRKEIDNVGWINNNGYVVCKFLGKSYVLHKLIWIYMTGKYPSGDIDHINGIRHDNRWSNLREATRSQNINNMGIKKSNTSGYRGIYKSGKGWGAKCMIKGKITHLGVFSTAQEASIAYETFAREKHGEFYRGIDYPIDIT